MIDYKTEWYGSRLVTADRWFPSSKKCSVCGYIMDKLPLSVRKWQCPQCETIHDRDYNASVNLKRTGSSPGSYACGDSSGGGAAPSRPTSYGSKKQEANTFCPIGTKG